MKTGVRLLAVTSMLLWTVVAAQGGAIRAAVTHPGPARPGVGRNLGPGPDERRVFYRGPDGALATNSTVGGPWFTPASITPRGAARPDSPIAAAINRDGTFQAFYVQPDGAIGSAMQVGGRQWRASAITQPGLVRGDSPLAAVRLGREISVFFVSPNGSISRILADLVTDTTPHVTAEAITPAGSAGNGTDLAAALRRTNEWHVFYQTTTGALVDVFFVPLGARFAPRVATPGWQSPVEIARPFVATPRSPIVALTFNNTQVHVFFVQPDNAVATTYGNDELFQFAPVPITLPGASRGDSPLAAAIRGVVIHVFYVRSDGALATTSMVRANVMTGPQYPWRTPFPITPPGAAGRGSRIAAVEHRDDQLHVFYQGPDGALATTWAVAPLPYPSGPWQTLSPITPPGAGSPGSPIVAVTGK